MNTQIVNWALIKIGESPISSTNQQPLGKILEIVYDEVRLQLLSTYPWRFAIKRVTLSPLAEESQNPRFEYKYTLPADCLLVRSIDDYNKIADLRDYRSSTGTRYEIEGKDIYSHENELNLTYIADVPDTMYTHNFKEAFANKIAAELSIKVHQNLNLVDIFEAKYQQALSQAIQHNEIEADLEEMPENTWLAVREGWRNVY